MRDTTTTGDKSSTPAPVELWDRHEVLRFFGGNRPLHTSTLYRGVNSGTYPKPITISGSSNSSGAVRWLAAECRDALAKMISARDEPKKPSRRGRTKRRRIA